MTVQPADGQQKTTKLERIGKRARHSQSTVFNNVGYVIDVDMLRECYQELDGKKAIGIDGISKASYGEKLEERLQDLLARIRKNAYSPQASRLVEIPKEDGSKRPLAISCFEDKIVQLAVSKLLTAIYEPTFLPCSYGYREGRNCHEALRTLMKYSNQNPNGATLEIDLKKYFNSIPHENLMTILREKISDRRFLKLVEKLIRSPILEGGKAKLNEIGCPQGSICSPIISNIYLHYVVDSWFAKISTTHMAGRADMVRLADDMVFIFQFRKDADRFNEVLPKRLEKYGLNLHQEKSSLIDTGSRVADEASKRGERLPTYKFLGFVCYWGQSRNGQWRLKYKSRSDRMTGKLKGLRRYLKDHRHQETHLTLRYVKRVVSGWINYHAISDNHRQVSTFILQSKRALFKWVNRKGGNRTMSWERFGNLLQRVDYPQNFRITSMFSAC